MKILLITQDDPFFLAKNLEYLIQNLPEHSSIVGSVLFDVSPFGKKETLLQKIKKTYSIFGLRFFLNYSYSFVINKLSRDKDVKYVLDQYKIPVIELEQNINKPSSLEIIKSYNPDLLVSIAGNQIFRKNLINLAPKGCINLHTALLPKYRGLMPSFWVLKNNEKYTGVSVFFVDEGIDSGPIIVQKKIKIGNMSQNELIKHSKKVGMDAILEAIDLIQKNEIKLIDNNDEEMTYFSFPTKNDVKEFRRIGKKFF